MAGLIRLGAVRALGKALTRTTLKPRTSRSINTSSKTSVTTGEASPAENKNWVSYGFSSVDPFIDRLSMHVTSFMSISLCLVIGGVFLAMAPDPKLVEWSQREAYLELRRRESLGLPPIDVNYLDPAKIQLPTDEELGDTEIII